MANYDGSNIKILEGLDAVRKRPGMYIGSTDYRGLHHLVWEIIDNAMDEALNGYGEQIDVTINDDQSITIRDYGRGVPVDMHESGIPTTEVIFTKLHAGGKFDANSYKKSGGLHGVGSSVTNALSTKLILHIWRDGYEWEQTFSEGGEKHTPLKKGKKTKETGTSVTFYPDPNIFDTTDFNFKMIATRMRESAFLNSGLKLTLTDLRTDSHEEFCYQDGIKAFIDYLTQEKKHISKPILIKNSDDSEIQVEIGLEYNETYNEDIISFVNCVRTPDGGTHEAGFKSGLTKTINEYARKNNLLKAKDKNFEGADVREGLTCIISVKIPENILQFEGQTKSKLGTPEAKAAVENIIVSQLGLYFDQNKTEATKIINKAITSRNARMAAKKARSEVRKGKNKKELLLSGKLTPAQTKKVEERELFLVEGDSAGGSAKQGRNRKYQAILPLRGKVVNTEKAKIEDIYKNEELSTIVNILGTGIGSEFDIKNLKYGKIVIMTDADTDGSHIQILLLTFFYRYLRPLIEEGHIFIAQPPLYKIATLDNKDVKYAWDEQELNKITKAMKKKHYVQRYKGLGEMDANQLWETTMDPERRQLIQLKIDDIVTAEKEVTTLMGNDVERRRDWIETNIDFNAAD